MKVNLTGKIILVTGASSGMGAETAKRFATLGARILLVGRNEERLKEVLQEIKNTGGSCEYFVADVGDYKAVNVMADKIKKEIGVPNFIFNNAGGGKWRFIEETEYEDIIEMIKAPYLGAFFVTKAFMPDLLKRNSGHIINMTSFAAMIPFSGATSYIASRMAMVGFHEALTADLYNTGIKTSLAYFAKVQSSFWEHNPGSEERLPLAQKMIPVITTEQAAQAIVDGVLKGKKKITAPMMISIVESLTYFFPFITRLIINKSGYKRR
ncbi:MAG: SDR family NAD(P)-dependent oxidoreductase [Thermodesulfovibrionales bacterium]|jgi:short-subunit dehydrogenase